MFREEAHAVTASTGHTFFSVNAGWLRRARDAMGAAVGTPIAFRPREEVTALGGGASESMPHFAIKRRVTAALRTV